MSSSLDNTFVLQEAVNNAVEMQLPRALQAILPGMLARLFAASTPSQSQAQSPSPSPNTKSHPMTSIKALVSAHMANLAKDKLQKYLDETLDHAAYQRDAADGAFEEVLDEHRLNVALVMDDGIADFNRVVDEKVAECKDMVSETVEVVRHHADEVCATACEGLDRFVDTAKRRHESDMLDSAQKRFNERQRHISLDRTGPRRQRAMSLPT